MRKCPICGEPLHNREKVCRNCGAFIDEKDVLTEEDEKDTSKEETSTKRTFNFRYPALFLILAIIFYITTQLLTRINMTIQKERYITIFNTLALLSLILIIPTLIITLILFRKNKTTNKKMSPQEILTANASFAEQRRMAFIGKNYVKISKEKFSKPAFLLTWIYLFYRKRYLLATIELIITILLFILSLYNKLIGNILGIYILIIAIIQGFLFNKIYIKKVTKKTKRMKDKKSKLTSEEFIKLCQKRGGTNLFFTIIIIVIFAISIFILVNIKLPTIALPKQKTKKVDLKYQENKELCTTYAKSIYNSYSKQNLKINFIGCNMNKRKSVIIQIISEEETYIAKYKISEYRNTLNLVETTKQLDELKQKEEKSMTEEEQSALNTKEEINQEFLEFSSKAKKDKNYIEININKLK